MQILLDNEELDVQLENEKILGEVLRGIANWLEPDAYYIKELLLDGKLYIALEQPNGEWDFDLFQQELTQIEKLELFSTPMQAYSQLEWNQTHEKLISESENTILTALQTLCDYFQMAHDAFKNQQFIFLKDFFSNPKPLLQLLERSVSQVESSMWLTSRQEETFTLSNNKNDKPSENFWERTWKNHLIDELKESLQLWNYFQDSQRNSEAVGNWNNDSIRADKYRITAILRDVPTLLKDLHERYGIWLSQLAPQTQVSQTQASQTDTTEHVEAAAPVELAQPNSFCDINICDIQAQLSQKSGQLEDALVQLQSGQLEQVLYYVSEVSLLLEQLIRQSEVQENKKLGALFQQMGPFLQELTRAIEDTNTVVIGDLVEYEIIPLIQQVLDELTRVN